MILLTTNSTKGLYCPHISELTEEAALQAAEKLGLSNTTIFTVATRNGELVTISRKIRNGNVSELETHELLYLPEE